MHKFYHFPYISFCQCSSSIWNSLYPNHWIVPQAQFHKGQQEENPITPTHINGCITEKNLEFMQIGSFILDSRYVSSLLHIEAVFLSMKAICYINILEKIVLKNGNQCLHLKYMQKHKRLREKGLPILLVLNILPEAEKISTCFTKSYVILLSSKHKPVKLKYSNIFLFWM